LSSTRQDRKHQKTLAEQRVGGARQNVIECAPCLHLAKIENIKKHLLNEELSAHDTLSPNVDRQQVCNIQQRQCHLSQRLTFVAFVFRLMAQSS
jgi:hypothetical protein